MGVYLTRILDELQGDVNTFKQYIIDQHPGGWSCLFAGEHGPRCYCHWEGREETAPNYFYGDTRKDGKIDTDCEWLYLVTPDGIVTRKLEWPPRSKAFLKKIGPMILSMEDAVRQYIGDSVTEEYGAAELQGFLDGTGWAFTAPLPPFCLQEQAAA